MFQSIDGVRVWDISAGRTFSLMLGDRDDYKTDVLFCGVMERYMMICVYSPQLLLGIILKTQMSLDYWLYIYIKKILSLVH